MEATEVGVLIIMEAKPYITYRLVPYLSSSLNSDFGVKKNEVA